MKNKNLEKFYNRVYQKGEKKHYTSLLLSGDKVPPAKTAVLKEISWKKKAVLDVGCGTGELANLIARRGAKQVMGIDYSKTAIALAKADYQAPNLIYACHDLNKIKGNFDVIVTLGTLEHVDNPLAVIKGLAKRLKKGGSLIITCPNWVNPRGYILMTLWYLFDARITLADIHHLTPIEFRQWAKDLGMKLNWKTVDHDWAHGEKLIRDFERRLPNIVRDSRLPTNKKKIALFINWLKTHILPLDHKTKFSGAVGLYHLRKQ